MSLYSIQFESISPMTAVPNSQTIFGTICHYYENIYGTEKLEELLQIQKKEPIFVVSSMFLKDTIPLPQNFMPQFKKINDENDLILLKETKKIQYISKELYLNEYKVDFKAFQELYFENLNNQNYVIKNNILMLKKEEKQFLNNFIKTQRTRTNTFEKEYYQNQILYFEPQTQFEFYIEIFNLDYIEKFKKLFSTMNYITFGGHKSIGYNMFNFVNMELSNNLKLNRPHLLLSLSIGDSSIDYQNSYYQLKQLNAKFNNAKDVVNRNQVLVFTEGSIIATDKSYIGQIIEETNNKKVTYQNVMGLLI